MLQPPLPSWGSQEKPAQGGRKNIRQKVMATVHHTHMKALIRQPKRPEWQGQQSCHSNGQSQHPDTRQGAHMVDAQQKTARQKNGTTN